VTRKLVSKVFVNRIQSILNDTISPLQRSFIQGCDNVYCYHSPIIYLPYVNSKKNSGDVIYKLELEKDDDKMDSYFLRGTLYYFGFPASTISLIMSIISTTFIFILGNGNKQNIFIPSQVFVKVILSHHISLFSAWIILLI